MGNAPDPIPSRVVLRKLLSQTLRSDEDLEAFCLDHFTDIQQRFGQGMDRLSKTNLLLELSSTAEILARMRQRFAGNIAVQASISQHLSGEALTKGEQSQETATQIERLYILRDQNLRQGLDITDLNQQIVALKRLQRQGPQLTEGDIFADRYRLLEIVGRGGFAKVWQAFDRQLERLVAIKILHSDLSEDRHRVERFERGARKMMELTHPHIVRVLAEPAQHEGFRFFVMEYLDGGDLGHAVPAGKLIGDHSLSVVLQTGEALAYAHTRNLIHRDVKPFNILLDGKQSARLTDFDLVLANDSTGGTRTGAMGTFIYAAPEALDDASRVDYRADVYSLGMTTLFVLYGKSLPVSAFRRGAFFVDQLECPRELKAVLRRAVAWHVEERYPSISAFCEDLKRAVCPTLPTPLKEDNHVKFAASSAMDDVAVPIPVQDDYNLAIPGHATTYLKEPVLISHSGNNELTTPVRIRSQEAAVPVKTTPIEQQLNIPITLSSSENRGLILTDTAMIQVNPAKRKRNISHIFALVTPAAIIAILSWRSINFTRPSAPRTEATTPAMEIEDMNRKLAEIENAIVGKRWSEVLVMADTLLKLQRLSNEHLQSLQSKRALAKKEAVIQKNFEQFKLASASHRYHDALRFLQSLPEESEYRQTAQQDYDQIVSLFVKEQLLNAESARIEHRCDEFDRLIQKTIDVVPTDRVALAARAKPCKEMKAVRISSSKKSRSSINTKQVFIPNATLDDTQTLSADDVTATDNVLSHAQTAFINGEYKTAIELAQSVEKSNPKRAWRIIGGAACVIKDTELVNKAFRIQDRAGRTIIINMCQGQGLVLRSNGFTSEE